MTTDIQYNGSVIASLRPGESSTVECSGSRMRGDIVISAAYYVDIIYNGKLIASLEKGQTLAEQYSIPLIETDYDTFLKNPEIDFHDRQIWEYVI